MNNWTVKGRAIFQLRLDMLKINNKERVRKLLSDNCSNRPKNASTSQQQNTDRQKYRKSLTEGLLQGGWKKDFVDYLTKTRHLLVVKRDRGSYNCRRVVLGTYITPVTNGTSWWSLPEPDTKDNSLWPRHSIQRNNRFGVTSSTLQSNSTMLIS